MTFSGGYIVFVDITHPCYFIASGIQNISPLDLCDQNFTRFDLQNGLLYTSQAQTQE